MIWVLVPALLRSMRFSANTPILDHPLSDNYEKKVKRKYSFRIYSCLKRLLFHERIALIIYQIRLHKKLLQFQKRLLLFVGDEDVSHVIAAGRHRAAGFVNKVICRLAPDDVHK